MTSTTVDVQSPRSAINVLIVEDDMVDARAVQRALRADGYNEYSLTHATKLADATRLLSEGQYDAILLDLNLPDGIGLETVEVIHRCAPDIPIVVLTGEEEESLLMRAVREGVQDYLVKSEIDDRILKRSLQFSVERNRTEQRIRRNEAQLRIRNRMLNVFVTTTNEGTYPEILDIILDVLRSKQGFIAWLGSLEGSAWFSSVADPAGPTTAIVPAPQPLSQDDWLALTERPMQHGLAVAENTPHRVPMTSNAVSRSIRLNVSHRGECVVAIGILNREVPYHDEDRELLESIGALLAPVVGARLQTDRTDYRRRVAEAELRAEKERAEVTLHSIGDAVITTDDRGLVEYLNPVAEELTGWTTTEAIGEPIRVVFDIINEETRKPVEDPIARCLRDNRVVGLANHTVLIGRTGREFAIQDSAAPIRGADGEMHGVVLVFNDVTETRRMAQEMSYQASHDALTGLINRRAFEERLARVIGTARDDASEHALCYLDLDQFKVINDTCGHMAGDELLRQLAECLKGEVRRRDTFARLGGDEFAILMEHCPLDQATRSAKLIRESIEKFRFFWEGNSFQIGASCGLVPITNLSISMAAVLSAADSACYSAKEQGRNRVHVVAVDDDELVERHGEMQWVSRINRALEQDAFHLYFQPIAPVAARGARGRHIEMLIRLVDDFGEAVLPATFLPAAERYGLAPAVDRWVVERTFSWLASNPAFVSEIGHCAINLSGQSLADEEMVGFLLGAVRTAPFPAAKICFEVTETSAIRNLGKGLRLMDTLKREGCQFSLDDFGSGLSSFGYLKTLPVDFLKIDGQFVRSMGSDAIDYAMVKSIHEIGKVMGKQTIAEFAETDLILEQLSIIGVDFAQGHAIAEPLPIEQYEKQ